MWLARDENGKLYIYEQKPEKLAGRGVWRTDGRMCDLDYDKGFASLEDVSWDDDEPTELILKKG